MHQLSHQILFVQNTDHQQDLRMNLLMLMAINNKQAKEIRFSIMYHVFNYILYICILTIITIHSNGNNCDIVVMFL